MKFILGKKIEMTQKYKADGTVIPVTKILAQPCVVTQIKKHVKSNALALQIGAFKRKHINKPMKGHLKEINANFLKEFPITVAEEGKYNVGDIIKASVFVPGDIVKVTGVSKGRGFQGVVKRHHFAGSPKTHGHKDQLRMPGSSGAGGVQHVLKGKRMGGRMGQDQVTITNLEIIEIDLENNFIYVKGAVPGSRNSLVWIRGEGELTVEKQGVAVKEQEAENIENKTAS